MKVLQVHWTCDNCETLLTTNHLDMPIGWEQVELKISGTMQTTLFCYVCPECNMHRTVDDKVGTPAQRKQKIFRKLWGSK